MDKIPIPLRQMIGSSQPRHSPSHKTGLSQTTIDTYLRPVAKVKDGQADIRKYFSPIAKSNANQHRDVNKRNSPAKVLVPQRTKHDNRSPTTHHTPASTSSVKALAEKASLTPDSRHHGTSTSTKRPGDSRVWTRSHNHTNSAVLPRFDPRFDTHNFPHSTAPMAPRVTDVVRHSLLPKPLNIKLPPPPLLPPRLPPPLPPRAVRPPFSSSSSSSSSSSMIATRNHSPTTSANTSSRSSVEDFDNDSLEYDEEDDDDDDEDEEEKKCEALSFKQTYQRVHRPRPRLDPHEDEDEDEDPISPLTASLRHRSRPGVEHPKHWRSNTNTGLETEEAKNGVIYFLPMISPTEDVLDTDDGDYGDGNDDYDERPDRRDEKKPSVRDFDEGISGPNNRDKDEVKNIKISPGMYPPYSYANV